MLWILCICKRNYQVGNKDLCSSCFLTNLSPSFFIDHYAIILLLKFHTKTVSPKITSKSMELCLLTQQNCCHVSHPTPHALSIRVHRSIAHELMYCVIILQTINVGFLEAIDVIKTDNSTEHELRLAVSFIKQRRFCMWRANAVLGNMNLFLHSSYVHIYIRTNVHW